MFWDDFQSIHPSIHLSIHPFIHSLIHPSIQSIHPFIHPFIHSLIHPSNPSIHPSNQSSTKPSFFLVPSLLTPHPHPILSPTQSPPPPPPPPPQILFSSPLPNALPLLSGTVYSSRWTKGVVVQLWSYGV